METKNKEVDELKLSKYSLKLCKEVQMALPHIQHDNKSFDTSSKTWSHSQGSWLLTRFSK